MSAAGSQPTWRDCGPIVRRCHDVTPEIVERVAAPDAAEERRCAASASDGLALVLLTVFGVVAFGLACAGACSFTH